ncbi:hypothetical protein QYF61_013859 [Mycteria americana]|uniref:Uncharacterized protein n=1 Tax=Mycteria americana TaxID=33587 RepID=A0AAN7MIK7_MYCAM|nr:hypothetical protein QYF61_013859 [Mycteria americana]
MVTTLAQKRAEGHTLRCGSVSAVTGCEAPERQITATCWGLAHAYRALFNTIQYPHGEEVSGSDDKTSDTAATPAPPATGTAATPAPPATGTVTTPASPVTDTAVEPWNQPVSVSVTPYTRRNLGGQNQLV